MTDRALVSRRTLTRSPGRCSSDGSPRPRSVPFAGGTPIGATRSRRKPPSWRARHGIPRHGTRSPAHVGTRHSDRRATRLARFRKCGNGCGGLPTTLGRAHEVLRRDSHTLVVTRPVARPPRSGLCSPVRASRSRWSSMTTVVNDVVTSSGTSRSATKARCSSSHNASHNGF